MNIKKLGVHGCSLGGLVATYLANSKSLDFLVGDRTFSSIDQVAAYAFHPIVSYLMLFFTFWDMPTSPQYLDTKCFKLTTFDPKDDVIPMMSSLAFGATKELLRRKYLHDHDYPLGEATVADPISQRGLLQSKSLDFILKKYPFAQRLVSYLPFLHRPVVQRLLKLQSEKYLEDYYTKIISSNDYRILYFVLKRLFNMIVDSSKLKARQRSEHLSDPDGKDHRETAQVANISFYRQDVSMIATGDTENILENLEEDQDGARTPVRELKLLAFEEERYPNFTLADEENESLQNLLLGVESQ